MSKKQMQIRITDELKEKLVLIARDRSGTLSGVIRDLIYSEWLKLLKRCKK